MKIRYFFLLLIFVYTLSNCATASHERVYMASINNDTTMLEKGFGPPCWRFPSTKTCVLPALPFFWDWSLNPFNIITWRGSQDVQNEKGNTALMWAVQQGNDEIIDRLLEKEAKVAIKDKYNETVLSFAAKYKDGKKSVVYQNLRNLFEKELFCDNLWQIFKGWIKLRNCLPRSSDIHKENLGDDDLAKLAEYSDGPIIKYGQLSTIKIPEDTRADSSDLLEKRNMKERDRLDEFRKASKVYKKEGDTHKNAIAQDRFDECTEKGEMILEEIKFDKEKDKKEIFKNEYEKHRIGEDTNKEDFLDEDSTTLRFNVFSIEDRIKLVGLKKRIDGHTKEIVTSYKNFDIYFDLAIEKTIEKDYQKMASMYGDIVLYKIKNYFEKKKALTSCTLEPFRNYDKFLEGLAEDVGQRMTDLHERMKNDPSYALKNIRLKFQKNESIQKECKALKTDPKIKDFNFRELSAIYGLCYYSLLKIDEKEANVYYKKVKELGDTKVVYELKEIRKKFKAGDPISPPSLGNADNKTASLDEPQSQKYKLAVLTFIDQTQNKKTELIRYSLADIITSELFITKRFDMVDREDLDQIEKEKESSYRSRDDRSRDDRSRDDRSRDDRSRDDRGRDDRGKDDRGKDDRDRDLVTEKTPQGVLLKSRQERDRILGKGLEIDGVLIGYITSIDLDKGILVIDYRIVNTVGSKILKIFTDQLKDKEKKDKEKRDKIKVDKAKKEEQAKEGLAKKETEKEEQEKEEQEKNHDISEFDYDDLVTLKFLQSLEDSIIFAGSKEIQFSYDKEKGTFSLERENIREVAKDIKESFADMKVINNNLFEEAESTRQSSRISPSNSREQQQNKVTLIKVLKIEGKKIIINVGSFHGIKTGFVGYVIEENDFGTHRYLAKFVVEQVFEKRAKCVVIIGDADTEGKDVLIK